MQFTEKLLPTINGEESKIMKNAHVKSDAATIWGCLTVSKLHLRMLAQAFTFMLIALLTGTTSAQTDNGRSAPDKVASDVKAERLPLMTIDQAMAANRGKLSQRTLRWIKIMEGVVAEGKKPGFSEANWNELAPLVDTDNFRRVGNFGEVMTWKEYTPMLTQWAKSSWFKGRIRRVREIGNLVYVDAEERISSTGDFGEDGGYTILHSLSVYEFDKNDRLSGLWIYHQSPK